MSPSDISVDLDKTSGLSNGDKITVTISSELKKRPVKSETKTFTVSGLKKQQVILLIVPQSQLGHHYNYF